MMRRFVVFFVLFGLCFQAPGAFTIEPPDCPMAHMMQTASASGEDITAALPDCCNDLATYDATGQACKLGADCSLPGALAFVPTIRTAIIDGSSKPFGAAHALARVAPIAPPWRPPAAL